MSTKRTPRLSATKMAEYSVIANASRRFAIVKMAKNPKGFVVTRYRKARFFAKEFFKSGFNHEILKLGVTDIQSGITKTDFAVNDQKKSLEALRCLKQIDFSSLKLGNCSVDYYEGDNPKLHVSGTNISVFPDLVLRGTYRGKRVVGVVKFHFSSSHSLTREGSLNGCVLLRKFAQRHIATETETVNHKLCILVDPFAGTCTTAPAADTRRFNSISAACREVKQWWSVA